MDTNRKPFVVHLLSKCVADSVGDSFLYGVIILEELEANTSLANGFSFVFSTRNISSYSFFYFYVLVLAEIIFFLAAGTLLSVGLYMRIMLRTHWCF